MIAFLHPSSQRLDRWLEHNPSRFERYITTYPEIADRIRVLRQSDPETKCILYLGLRPFTRDFILFLERETIERLADLGCELSAEYFDDN